MKKFYQLAFVLCSVLMTQYGYAQDYYGNDGCCPTPAPVNEAYDNGTIDQPACPPEAPTGEYWCKFVTYEPCWSTCQRCVEEPCTYQKKCCRMVPQYYEVQKCRYVPEYYNVTCCRQVPEYYCVDQCYTKKRYVCDKKCRYVPRYYWKKVCAPQEGAAVQASQDVCVPNPCCR